MSLKMHSKFIEEVNRLAERFSRLTLSDEKKRSSIRNEYNQFVDDKSSTKVKKSISVIKNSRDSKEMFPSSAGENTYVTSDDKTSCTTICTKPLLEYVNKEENPSYENSSTILSSPVSEGAFHAPTCEMEVIPTSFENKDKKSLDKTSITRDYNSNVQKDVTSNHHVPIQKTELLLENTVEKYEAASGDKTPEIKIDVESLNKGSINCTTLLDTETVSIDAVKDDVETSNVDGNSSIESFPQAISVEDTEAVVNKAKSDKIISLKFYAVALPKNAEQPEDPNSLIYTEFKDTLSAAKSCKGSRFKEFAKKKDALQFASKPLEDTVAKAKAEDDLSTLRSATCQELCQLRKCIERGDEANFINIVWRNPKILVGSCDTPSIMQEGMRYNALHVAAKSNRPYICQLILDTIENPKFLQPIYPTKTEIEREKIVYRLLDLYINTPDKKTGDTPLHYASKFGCIDCVKVLLAHPFCVPDRRNIAGFTPREIICNRLDTKSVSLIEGIEEAFNGLLYIPLLRSKENDEPPIIGEPCTCQKIIESTRGTDLNDAKATMSLKAFVGPMFPEIAEQFYLVLKKPSSFHEFLNISQVSPEERESISKIRYNDRENGLERIGRWLARDSKVQWHEYFPFLDTFTNLALDEGLRSLESHLKTCQPDQYVPSASTEEQSVFLVHQYPSHVNPLSHYVNVHLDRKREKEVDNKYNESFCTPPSSPTKNQDVDCFMTPPVSPSQYSDALSDDAVFLQGSCISKLDVDVLLAIGDATVNATEYPNVSKWKSLVESRLKNPEKTRPPCVNSLSFLTTVALPRLHLSEKICTPKKTMLNNAFRLESSN